MKVNQELLIKDIHFPLLKPLETQRNQKFFGKIKDFLTYRRKFEFVEDWCVYSKKIRQFIFIPKTFIIDGASVPKVLYFSYSPTGVLFYGSFPHDFGYRYEGLFLIDQYNNINFVKFDKSDLDDLFLEICSQENHMPTVSKVAKTTLSIFGFTGWWSNRKKNNNIKEDFPQFFWTEENINLDEN